MQTHNGRARAVAIRAGSKPLRSKRSRRSTDRSGNHDRGAWKGAHRKRWLHGPAELQARDSAVRALLDEGKGVRMSKEKLSESAIDERLAYLADESWEVQKKYRRRSK